MGRYQLSKPSAKRLVPLATALVVLVAISIHVLLSPAYGAELGARSLQISTNEISKKADYQLTINLSTAGTLGSIKMQICSNDPFPGTPCIAPNGFSASAAVLADQDGPGGFTINSASTANEIILSRTPANTPVAQARYHFTNVTNPDSQGSYYVRVLTYASNNASGTSSDYGGIAFIITNQLSISARVPPYLIFCTGVTIGGLNCQNVRGDQIDFGELSARRAGSSTSQMLVATNAEQGYVISASGTTLTSGNNVINPLASGDVSRPGTGQFGFNLRANAAPLGGSEPSGPGTGVPQSTYGQPNIFRFSPGDTIATNPVADNVRIFTAHYIVNIPASQPAGIYVSTVTYVCLANF